MRRFFPVPTVNWQLRVPTSLTFKSQVSDLARVTLLSCLFMDCGGQTGDTTGSSSVGGSTAVATGAGGVNNIGTGGHSTSNPSGGTTTGNAGTGGAAATDASTGGATSLSQLTPECPGVPIDINSVRICASSTSVDGARSISCDKSIPPLPVDTAIDLPMWVIYQPYQGKSQKLPMVGTAADCSDTTGGWYYDNPDAPTKITLCPCSCATQADGSIDLIYRCHNGPTII